MTKTQSCLYISRIRLVRIQYPIASRPMYGIFVCICLPVAYCMLPITYCLILERRSKEFHHLKSIDATRLKAKENAEVGGLDTQTPTPLTLKS